MAEPPNSMNQTITTVTDISAPNTPTKHDQPDKKMHLPQLQLQLPFQLLPILSVLVLSIPSILACSPAMTDGLPPADWSCSHHHSYSDLFFDQDLTHRISQPSIPRVLRGVGEGLDGVYVRCTLLGTPVYKIRCRG